MQKMQMALNSSCHTLNKDLLRLVQSKQILPEDAVASSNDKTDKNFAGVVQMMEKKIERPLA